MIAHRPAIRTALVAGLLLVGGAIAYACAGPAETPTWEVAKVDYDAYGSGAILVPGNDTRANLLLLLADRQGFAVRSASATNPGPPLVFMTWRVMREQLVPGSQEGEYAAEGEPSRCQTLSSGAAAFNAALNSSRATSSEKASLATARRAMVADCNANSATVADVATTSAAGRAFANYLRASADFYAGRFDRASSEFAGLRNSDDRWVSETASYMVGRTALNRAIVGSTDEYGSLAPLDKRDVSSAGQAGTAFAAYLKDYSGGRYATSARGLMRRVHWIAGQATDLAEDYGAAIASGAVRDGSSAADLAGELDYKLLTDLGAKTARDPLMLAVIDLQRMRPLDDYEREKGATRISRGELDAQAALFRDQRPLFDYLKAAEAMFVRGAPREVLALIPDAAHQPCFTYLEFSRQMLRGIALDAVSDPNAQGFWTSLMPGATQPYQHGAAELAQALHDERSGHVEQVFAAGSPITHPVMRDLLLQFVAGPDLLRRQARGGQDQHERKVALYILLAKQLQRGFYRDFLADATLLPAQSKDNDGWWGAQYYNATYSNQLTDPPLGAFLAAPVPQTGCAPLKSVVAAIAADPRAIRPKLCLAEFFRVHSFDNFDFDAAPEDIGLGRGRPQFPGKPYVRMATYLDALADPKSSADDSAFALNRMVRCYAPAGSSSCGSDEVPAATRKAWYDRLKRDYPASPWAKELRYYW